MKYGLVKASSESLLKDTAQEIKQLRPRNHFFLVIIWNFINDNQLLN